jgi:hypothetical protein
VTPPESFPPRHVGAAWRGRLLGAEAAPTGDPTYFLTRFVLLRWLGLVYLFGFLAAAQQAAPLFGPHGLLPADSFFARVSEVAGSRAEGFCLLPSLFWFDSSDAALAVCGWLGVALSLVVVCGFANAPLLLVLWALYLSFIHAGQLWYSYGWEIQLVETGLLATFLCPTWDMNPFSRRPPPMVVLWLFRWLIFRIMLGAGLIKLRGDPCWRELTCLYHHYETQPIPNPFSWWLHFQPHWFHQLGALWNHLIELVVPWFAFGPRRVRHVAGVLLTSFQVCLILSGNLSFFNWLTIVPCLACFDDSFWPVLRLLPRRIIQRAASVAMTAAPSRGQHLAALAYAAIVALLSLGPVGNMLSSRQAMNTSFDRLHLVNTYGAFGSVGEVRNEIVFEGTRDPAPGTNTVWREYEFPAKPGDPMRRPPIIAPYQPRLDWQIWFAAMASPNEYPWTVHFVWKLLHNDAPTLSLLANNPFPEAPPRFIRASFYRYEFAPSGSGKAWWKRTREGLWLPPLSADNPSLERFLIAHGWLPTPSDPGLKRK